jgi:hypothetical protein
MQPTYDALRSPYALYDYLSRAYPTVQSLRADVCRPLGIALPHTDHDCSLGTLVVQLIEECKYRGSLDSLIRLAIQTAPSSRSSGGTRDRERSVLHHLQLDRGLALVAVVAGPGLDIADQEFAGQPAVLVPRLHATDSFFDHMRLIDSYMSNAWACLAIVGRDVLPSQADHDPSLELPLHHAIMRGLYVHVLAPAGREGDAWLTRIFPRIQRGFGGAWRKERVERYDATTGYQQQLRALLEEKLPRRSGKIEAYVEDVGVVCRCKGHNSSPFTIAHLSDLHFSRETNVEHVWQVLLEDLQEQDVLRKTRFLVISGDLTTTGAEVEFKLALDFVKLAQRELGLPAEHVVVVPGNHDLSWDQPVYDWVPRRDKESPFAGDEEDVSFCRGFLRRNDGLYPWRFRGFADFYWNLKAQPYPLAPERQALVHTCPGYGLQFLGLNSAHRIDEQFPRRSGLCEEAVDTGLKMVEGHNTPGCFRIGVWHHPIREFGNDAVLERLAKARFRLCLHGHLHDTNFDGIHYRFHGGLRCLGAGSLGAGFPDRPEGIPQLYHLLEVRPKDRRILLKIRARRRSEGPWGPWKGLTESVSFRMSLR